MCGPNMQFLYIVRGHYYIHSLYSLIVFVPAQYPYRCVQIVLRLYHSPAEVLAGFDVDAPCVMYDGNRVMANPRAIVAFMRQCNTIDITRRSPSYEIRLIKYAERGFEILVPDLRRNDVDPTVRTHRHEILKYPDLFLFRYLKGLLILLKV